MGIKLRVGATVEELRQALQEAGTQIERLEQKITQAAGRSQKAKQAEIRLIREAQRAYSDSLSPVEQYNRKMASLKGLLDRNKISQNEYTAAAKRSQQALMETGKAGQSAFGTRALSQIKGFATGFLGLGVAIGIAKTALSDLAAEREALAEKQRAAQRGIGSLAQVATSRAHMEDLVTKAERLYAGGGAQSLDEAGRIIFALQSAGQVQYANLFKEMRATGLVESPDVMAGAAQALMSTIGKGETGNVRAILSKAFGASAYSPVSAEALLQAAARGGGGAAAMGVSDEELLAATAMTATATRSAEMGATQVTSLLKSLQKLPGQAALFEQLRPKLMPQAPAAPELRQLTRRPWEKPEAFERREYMERERFQQTQQRYQQEVVAHREKLRIYEAETSAARERAGRFSGGLKGKTLMGMVESLEARGLNDQELFELFGRAEAVNAFRTLLRNRELYRQALGDIHQAETSDELGRKLEYYTVDPRLRRARKLSEAEAQEELASERLGIAQQLFTEWISRETKFARQRGDAEWPIGISRRVSKMRGGMYGPEALLHEALQRGQIHDPELREDIAGFLGGAGTSQGEVAWGLAKGVATFGMPRNTRGVGMAALRLSNAAGQMDQAAGNLDQATRGGATLSQPDRDR